MLQTLSASFVRHRDLSEEQLSQIISIKRQHWDYSEAQHRSWITNNIRSEDVHLMLKHNDESVIGYLNLVDVELTTRSTCNSILGIGNVAVATDYQGLKLGHLLLNATWAFLRSERKTGMLICKPQLVQFYKKAGWFSFHGSVLNGGLVLTHEVFFSEDMNYLEKLKVNRQF